MIYIPFNENELSDDDKKWLITALKTPAPSSNTINFNNNEVSALKFLKPDSVEFDVALTDMEVKTPNCIYNYNYYESNEVKVLLIHKSKIDSESATAIYCMLLSVNCVNR